MQDVYQFLEERKKYRTKNGKKKYKDARGFIDKIFMQVVISSAILIFFFTFKLFPLTNPFYEKVKSLVNQNYYDNVIEVFNREN